MNLFIRNILISSLLIIIFQSIFYYFTMRLYTKKIKEIQKTEWSGLFTNNKEYIIALLFLIVIIGFNYFVINNKGTPYDGFFFGIVLGSFFNGINYVAFDNWSTIGILFDTLFVGLNAGLVVFIISKV